MKTNKKLCHSQINLLTKQTPWYGKHSGYYEMLPRFLEQIEPSVRVSQPRRNILTRCLGKAYSIYRSYPPRDQSLSCIEWCFRHGISGTNTNHILNLEDHLPLLTHWQEVPKNLIGTLHFPPEWWEKIGLHYLERLSSAIVLYQDDLEFFEAYIGQSRVKFIHHGVDTVFFKPPLQTVPVERRLIFVGQFLRNTAMLSRIIPRLLKRHPKLKFDFVVAKHGRNAEGLDKLLDCQAITWHQNISDTQLSTLYQQSYLMLLPLNASGANNAVVEALACGLPIVTTDVGGIHDYGGNSIFPLVANNDDEAMINLVEDYLARPDWRNAVSRKARALAEEQLAWPVVAEKHFQTYHELLS